MELPDNKAAETIIVASPEQNFALRVRELKMQTKFLTTYLIHFVLTFAICHYETFFQYNVGENSPILLKRNFFTMYSFGEKSPMTFT